jgi:hypothetical protein
LHQQTQLTKTANAQALVELSSPFNLQLIQDQDMADFWVNGHKKYDEYDEVEKYCYRSLLVWWLILHESIYYQWQSGLLDEQLYFAWAGDLEQFVVEQRLWLRWDHLKINFQEGFRSHVDALINQSVVNST